MPYWPEVAAILAPTGVLSTAEGPALALFVETLARYLEALELADESDMIAKNDKGSVYMHPAQTNLASWQKRYDVQLGKFGLDPSSRAGTTIATRVKLADGSNNRSKLSGA